MAHELSDHDYMSRYPHAYKNGMRARLSGASIQLCTLRSAARREAWLRGYWDTVSVHILDENTFFPLFARYPAAYQKGADARYRELPYVCPLKTPHLINAWMADYCDEDHIQNGGNP